MAFARPPKVSATLCYQLSRAFGRWWVILDLPRSTAAARELQRAGCHPVMEGHWSPSLAASYFQPAPAGQEALAARWEAGGTVGSAWAGSIRRRRRPRHQASEAQTRAPFGGAGPEQTEST